MINTLLYGFHAITARLRQAPSTVDKIWYERTRRDRRMQDFLRLAQATQVKLIAVDADRLHGLAGTTRHQGVVAQLALLQHAQVQDLSEWLDRMATGAVHLLLLVLDGITDPHNLGACLRTAHAAGAHALIAPRDRAVGLNATVRKVASGAAEAIPYIVVTNLVRALRACQARGIGVIGMDAQAPTSLYETQLTDDTALVMGAEGQGMRRLTRDTCDALVHIPMAGTVESLNVAVASGIGLFEARRQRISTAFP